MRTVILQMRICAIYSRNRFIVCLTRTCFVACYMASGIIIGLAYRNIDVEGEKVYFPMNNCLSTQGRPTTLAFQIPHESFCLIKLPHLYACCIPILVFETLLFGLALMHGYRDYRNGRRDVGAFKFFDHRRLSDILVRDSVIYFFA